MSSEWRIGAWHLDCTCVFFYSLFAIRYSLFAIRYSLFAIRYSLLATNNSLLATRYSLPSHQRCNHAVGWTVTIHEGADIDDHLLAHFDAAFDGG